MYIWAKNFSNFIETFIKILNSEVYLTENIFVTNNSRLSILWPRCAKGIKSLNHFKYSAKFIKTIQFNVQFSAHVRVVYWNCAFNAILTQNIVSFQICSKSKSCWSLQNISDFSFSNYFRKKTIFLLKYCSLHTLGLSFIMQKTAENPNITQYKIKS